MSPTQGGYSQVDVSGAKETPPQPSATPWKLIASITGLVVVGAVAAGYVALGGAVSTSAGAVQPARDAPATVASAGVEDRALEQPKVATGGEGEKLAEVVKTALTKKVAKGSTEIFVETESKFKVGDSFTISGGGNSETRTITSFGSIEFDEPLENEYPRGSTVQAAQVSQVESVGFGKDRVCLTENGDKGVEGTDFKTHKGVEQPLDCKKLCGAACTGVEYDTHGKGCKVWSSPVGGAAEEEGSTCLRHKHKSKTHHSHSAKKQATTTTTQEDKSGRPKKCGDRFKAPKKPKTADEHNGAALEDTCFEGDGPHHVFIIGDWGGITQGDGRLAAAPHLTHRWETNYNFVWPADEQCQTLVRDQMRKRAPDSRPDYFLNVGDNFYWAGIEDHCGAEDIADTYSMGGTTLYQENKVNQFDHVFEKVYTGEGIDDKQWLGVMGNHDWGGWLFTHAWDQNIGYTWSKANFSTGRWMTPAMYWQAKVWYSDFSVDYYFLDTNIFDALDPKDPSPHNICSETHNDDKPVSCAPVGPSGVWKCQEWFGNLWKKQLKWLDEVVPESTAHWRIAVTHFPPCWGAPQWKKLAHKHEFDLVVAGHRHIQDMHMPGDNRSLVWHADPNGLYNDFLDPVPWLVSGGGGGVTSEREPDNEGHDDQYGFMDMALEKDQITIEAISHGGDIRRKEVLRPSWPHHPLYDEKEAKKRAEEAKKSAYAWWKKHPHAKEEAANKTGDEHGNGLATDADDDGSEKNGGLAGHGETHKAHGGHHDSKHHDSKHSKHHDSKHSEKIEKE